MIISVVEILYCLAIIKEIPGVKTSKASLKCRGVNCSDTDYDVEDTVRNVLENYDSNNEILQIQIDNSNTGNDVHRFNELQQGNKLELWKTFWSEWDGLACSVANNCANSPSDENVPICYDAQQMRYEECKLRTGFDISRACIGVKSKAFSQCEMLTGKDMPIPICKEKSTNKVFTCEETKSAFICFSTVDNGTSPVWPCRISSRQVCIHEKGFLINCDSFKNNLRREDTNLRRQSIDLVFTQMRNWAEWWKEWVLVTVNSTNENPVSETTELCRYQHNSTNIEYCGLHIPRDRLCVSAKDGLLTECRRMKNSEIPVTICVENSSRKVVTCGNFTPAFLCFSESGNTLSLRPCRVQDRQACVSPSNALVRCRSFNSLNLNNKNRRASTKNENDTNLSQSNHTAGVPLCYNKDNLILPCKERSGDMAVCLNQRNGRIAKCKELQKKIKNPVHICVMDSQNNALVICKGNNLCLFGSKLKKVLACNDKKQYACVIQGDIKTCPSTIYFHYDPETEMDTDFANSPLVFMAERLWSKLLHKDLRHLCILHTSLEFTVCREAPKLSFMCIGLQSGVLDKCSNYTSDEIVMPVCVQTDGKLVVCGKFSTANICGKTLNLGTLLTCADESLYLCLIAGDIKMCSRASSPYPKNHLNTTRRHRRQGTVSNSYRKYVNKHKNIDHLSYHVMHDVYDDYYQDEDEKRFYRMEQDLSNGTQTEYIPPYDYVDEDKIQRKAGYEAAVRRQTDEEILKDLNSHKKEKFLSARVASSHLYNQHLCFQDDEKLANCDDVRKKNFACLSAYGREISACSTVKKPDVAVPVCKKVDAHNLMTCDQFSNIHLCFSKDNVKNLFEPCNDKLHFACLTNEMVPVKCAKLPGMMSITNKKRNLVYRHTSEASVLGNDETPEISTLSHVPQQDPPAPKSTDEKFFRLHCHNCTIENTFVVEGNLDDAYPELEVITFPN